MGHLAVRVRVTRNSLRNKSARAVSNPIVKTTTRTRKPARHGEAKRPADLRLLSPERIEAQASAMTSVLKSILEQGIVSLPVRPRLQADT